MVTSLHRFILQIDILLHLVLFYFILSFAISHTTYTYTIPSVAVDSYCYDTVHPHNAPIPYSLFLLLSLLFFLVHDVVLGVISRRPTPSPLHYLYSFFAAIFGFLSPFILSYLIISSMICWANFIAGRKSLEDFLKKDTVEKLVNGICGFLEEWGRGVAGVWGVEVEVRFIVVLALAIVGFAGYSAVKDLLMWRKMGVVKVLAILMQVYGNNKIAYADFSILFMIPLTQILQSFSLLIS